MLKLQKQIAKRLVDVLAEIRNDEYNTEELEVISDALEVIERELDL